MKHKGSAAPLVLIVVLLAIGFLMHVFTRKAPAGPVVPASGTVSLYSDISDWTLYRSGELGFEIKHPKDFAVDENYRYTFALPTDPSQNPIPGVAFTLPVRFYTGTNLASGSLISVEASKDLCQIDKMQSYGGASGDVPNSTEELGGLVYKVVMRSDAGAGNFYTDVLYATGRPATNGTCYGVRMFLHSLNIGVLKESNPAVKEYDRDGIERTFKDMIKTITFI